MELATHDFAHAAEFGCRLLVRRADETLGISKLQQSLRKPNAEPLKRNLFDDAQQVRHATAEVNTNLRNLL